jgi:hypothetical protein
MVAWPGEVTSRSPFARILAGMGDLLVALHALRPLWLPLLVLILSAGAGLALIAWGGFSIFADSADAARFSW